MGSFFGSVNIKGLELDTVICMVKEICNKESLGCGEDRAKFLISPERKGWISIYPSGAGQDQRVSKIIAKKCKAIILHLSLYHSDMFSYVFYKDGLLIDEYCSDPIYFDGISPTKVTEEEKEKLKGNPYKFLEVVNDESKVEEIKELLQVKEDEFNYAEYQIYSLGEILEITYAACSYEDLYRDLFDLLSNESLLTNDEDFLIWLKQLVHIP